MQQLFQAIVMGPIPIAARIEHTLLRCETESALQVYSNLPLAYGVSQCAQKLFNREFEANRLVSERVGWLANHGRIRVNAGPR